MVKIIGVLICANTLWGACIFTCKPIIVEQSMQASLKISSEFGRLMNSLKNLENSYKNYLNVYEEQNRLLKKLQDLRAYNSKKLSEVAFLLETINSLMEIKIVEKGETNAKK